MCHGRYYLCVHGSKIANMTKYNNIKYKGYASKKEYYRAQELKLLESKHIISGLEEQAKYELVPSQRDENGRVIERPVRYIADFQYLRDGELVVEDTKGVKTKDYIIKRKLMLHVHGIRIKEV